MMKTKLNLFLFLFCFTQFAWTVDPVPNLIVTEIFMGDALEAYAEITNIGTTPADLSRVVLNTALDGINFTSDTSRRAQWLYGAPILAPGESFVVINHNTDLINYDIILTPLWYYRYADYWLWRTKRFGNSGMQFGGGNDKFGLFYDLDDEGSGTYDPDLDTLLDFVGKDNGGEPWDVAGVTNASLTHLLIRKAGVTKGTDNFENSAGISWEDSEWIPIPYNPDQLGNMFTSVGRHGNTATWNFSLKNGTITDDKITMPWGAWRDSIYKELNVGPNMAWHLRWGADTLESNVVQTGDTLLVYLCGDEVETRKYAITVMDPHESNNKLFPLFSRDDAGDLTTQFLVTEDNPVIDTLHSVPFSSRIDSVLKYLEIASNAKMEYKTFDGAARADVKTGDKLVVTAKDGSKKEYFVKPDAPNPSDNAKLQTILIDNDTLWNFSTSTLAYKFILSPGVQQFPSISATAQSANARVVIKQPAFIRGSGEDRTATIKVIAENDTTILNYTLTFDLPKAVQVNKLDPFISQVINSSSTKNRGAEIFNPGNVPLSLVDYMFCLSNPAKSNGPNSLEEAISERDSLDWVYLLKFGYYFDNKRAGEGVYFKEATNYVIDVDPFQTFFMKKTFNDVWGGADFYSQKNDAKVYDYYGWPDGGEIAVTQEGINYWLLKCTNDSIANGTKSADDINDWIFLDIWGTVGEGFDHTRTLDGEVLSFKLDRHQIRKGHIWHGNTVPYGSLDEPDGPGSSEWNIIVGEAFYGPDNDVRRHAGFIKPTNYMSTITSSGYIVSLGSGNNESIRGVPPGSTATVFYGNVFKADPDQTLALMAVEGSGERGASDALQTGDTLVVKSKDLKNTTRYTISTSTLSNDAVLTSDLYNIGVSGSTGTIDTIVSYTTINALLSHLTLPSGSFMNIIDNQRRHVPLLLMAPDTNLVIDPIVHDSIFLEVIAEDGSTRILYSLVMEESLPYITSNVYFIYEDDKVIDLWIYNTNFNTFLYNVTPSTGATIKVLDKYDFQRTEGVMFIDDKVVVTNAQNVSATYTLHEFYDVEIEEPNSIRGSEKDELPNAQSIYPNPAESLLNIGGLETGSKVVVIDMLGHIREIREAYSSRMEIDLSGYSGGIYFIRVIKDNKSVTYKFIKK